MKRTLLLFLTATLLASCASAPTKHNCIWYPPGHIVPFSINWICNSNGMDPTQIMFCLVDTNDIIMQIDSERVITVSTGFINEFSYDNDLITLVIAHELAHYKLDHIPKGQGVAIGTSIVFTVANIFIPGIAYADYLVNPTLTSAFSRSFELDADVEAVRLCKNAGMSDAAEKYCAAMGHMASESNSSKGLTYIWASHPPIPDRIENIRKTFLLEKQP